MIFRNDIEEFVIGALLTAYNSVAVHHALRQLTQDCFYVHQHKVIFKIMFQLLCKNIDVNANSVLAEIHSDDHDLYRYVASLWKNSHCSTANLEHWIAELQRLSELRKISQKVQKLQELLLASSTDTEKQLSDALKLMQSDIELQPESNIPVHAEIVAQSFSDEMRKRNDGIAEFSFPSNIEKLDELTDGGFEIGLITIAGRPAMGKTTFLISLIAQMGVINGHPIYISSLEMTREQLMLKLISHISGISANTIKKQLNTLTIDETERYNNALEQVSNTKIHFNSDKAVSLQAIINDVRYITEIEDNSPLVFIDYVQLVQLEGKFDNRVLQLSKLTWSLKLLSKELKKPIFILAQLNRELERRSDKRPILSDLRESGSIENDSDMIIFLYRDSVYNEHSIWRNVTEFILAKHRFGERGLFYLALTAKGFIEVDDAHIEHLKKQQHFDKDKKYEV